MRLEALDTLLTDRSSIRSGCIVVAAPIWSPRKVPVGSLAESKPKIKATGTAIETKRVGNQTLDNSHGMSLIIGDTFQVTVADTC